MEFKHPKYYKELRSIRNKLDQVISDEASTEATSVHPGPGLKLQAASLKQAIQETVPQCDIEEATSPKPQAPRDASFKQQASSPDQQASSFKPQASSSMIREPRNM